MDKLLNRLILTALYILVAMQVIVPVYLTVKSELALTQGKEFKFRVRPVDPYDPFRGRYTSLGMARTSAEAPQGANEKSTVYAVLRVNADGFAETAYLSVDRPAQGTDFAPVTIDHIYKNSYPDNGKYTAYFRYPFDKIFYNEKIAPEIDKAFWSFRGTIYVTVFIKDGNANIGKLYFGGVEAEEYVKKGK